MMKTLYESILDDEDEIMARMDDAGIKEFLEKNYIFKGTYKINKNHNTVDVNGSVRHIGDEGLTNGYFKFGKVTGDFDCRYNYNILNLKGAPDVVKGNFLCGECEKLESLEGSPKKVEGKFNCYGTAIKNLKGCPEVIGGEFDCSYCSQLTDINDVPKKLKGDLILRRTMVDKKDAEKIAKKYNISIYVL